MTNIRLLMSEKYDNFIFRTEYRIRHNRPVTKTLFGKTFDGVHINIRLNYNSVTNFITFTTAFSKSSKAGGGTDRNRSCATFLGIHVAERVLSHVFKNVERMSSGNPGFDFICGKGYKVDVKSACIRRNRNAWGYNINCNKIADYFLFIAFDNRSDLKPLHIWLVPGSIVNDKKSATFSLTKLYKWSKYEKANINDVIVCCDTIRG